jgi:hypothetical protein
MVMFAYLPHKRPEAGSADLQSNPGILEQPDKLSGAAVGCPMARRDDRQLVLKGKRRKLYGSG